MTERAANDLKANLKRSIKEYRAQSNYPHLVQFWVSREDLKKIKRLTEDEGRSITNLMRQLIRREWLRHYEE